MRRKRRMRRREDNDDKGVVSWSNLGMLANIGMFTNTRGLVDETIKSKMSSLRIQILLNVYMLGV